MNNLVLAFLFGGISVLTSFACLADVPAASAQCTVKVVGLDGRNALAEQVASVLHAHGCVAGVTIRLTDIQPVKDMQSGRPVGIGSYYRELLCKRNPDQSVTGPDEGVQDLACSYNGEDAKPAE